jgi:hypothetical protein
MQTNAHSKGKRAKTRSDMKKHPDTERLDWLEQNARGIEVHYDEDSKFNEWWVEENWHHRQIRNSVREAIDAARGKG